MKPAKHALLLCAALTLCEGCASDRAPLVSSAVNNDPTQDAGDDREDEAPAMNGDASDASVDTPPDADDGEVAQASCPDLDRDGFPALVEGCESATDRWDCDDNDEEVNPDAQEVCDGRDNDCDQDVDEGLTNACGGCEALAFQPGEPCGQCGVGVCAGAENTECVGDAPELYFRDRDRDGFGKGEPRALCAPEGAFRTQIAGDCDDTNRDISPDATEVCDGGVDNDCDERTTELSVCSLLRFDGPQNKWAAPPLDMTHPLAPTTAVRAAFTGKDDGVAWLLTERTWHRFSVNDATWRSSGQIGDTFPDINDLRVKWAYAIPGSHLGEAGMQVFIYVGGGAVFHYRSSPDFSSFEYLQTLPLSGWDSPFAPTDTEDARAVWLDLSYSQDWFSSSPGDLCVEGEGGELTVIAGVISAEAIHLQESGYCFGFIERVPNDAFPPFTRPGAPSPDSIDASFWLDSLYIWRSTE